ncbi:MAG: hypothetical protein K0S24_941 [Sphingobacterium sp.]|jgi:hypothetical protein|nr:hypothetical protein [Sphingobacterium sp.]
MNGIIFKDSKVYVGCSAKFLFKPEIGQEATPAIAEFYGGVKAYAEIAKVLSSEVIIRLGEYVTANGIKIPEKMWRLVYEQENDSWNIMENIQSKSHSL